MKKFIFLTMTILCTFLQVLCLNSDRLNSNISRAGVGIIVPLSKDAICSLNNYGIIVGHDKNLNLWMIGQAGKIDAGETIEVAAARELFEETGCYMKISPEEIKKMSSIMTDDKKLFLMKRNNLSLAQQIHESVQNAQNNKKLSPCCKEIDSIEVVALSTLLDLAKQIESNSLHSSQIKKGFFPGLDNYYITTTSGRKILLDGFYMRMFANTKNPDLYKNAYNSLHQLIKMN